MRLFFHSNFMLFLPQYSSHSSLLYLLYRISNYAILSLGSLRSFSTSSSSFQFLFHFPIHFHIPIISLSVPIRLLRSTKLCSSPTMESWQRSVPSSIVLHFLLKDKDGAPIKLALQTFARRRITLTAVPMPYSKISSGLPCSQQLCRHFCCDNGLPLLQNKCILTEKLHHPCSSVDGRSEIHSLGCQGESIKFDQQSIS